MATKTLMRDQGALMKQIESENEHFLRLLSGDDAREALRAFAERRPPIFNRRSSVHSAFADKSSSSRGCTRRPRCAPLP